MACFDFLSRAVLTVAAAGIVAVAGCGKTEVVSVDGSGTVFLISAAVAEEFHAVNPAIAVVVGQSGTGGGFKKFTAGEIAICNASRPMTENEAKACAAAGIEYLQLQVAFDGLAVVVNPENDWCNALSVEQLKAIWRKEAEDSIVRWSDVNPDWPDEEFKLYGPGADSGTFDYFTEVINGKARSCRSDYSPSENDNALVTGVAGDRGSLGYFGYGYYIENKDKLKLLQVDGGQGGVLPSPSTVRDGSYQPLSRPLQIYVRTSALRNPHVVEFLRYYLDRSAELAEAVGYVGVTHEINQQNRARLEAAVSQVTASRPAA